MRHNKKFNHLGRTASHRASMLANMAISLIMHKRITTTVAKAKALKKYVEPLIAKAKEDSTNSRRVVFSYLENNDVEGNQEFDEEILHMRQLLKTKLVDMNLSVRALNCLKAADVETLGDLVQYNKTDLLKFRNFGKKSLTELDDLLESLNLSFGTDISKYKLDKE